MELLNNIKTNASKLGKTIILAEPDDIRMLLAANALVKEKICKVLLPGNPDIIKLIAQKNDLTLEDSITIIDPDSDSRLQSFTDWFYEKRKAKGMTIEMANKLMKQPLYFASAMVAHGFADGCVAGAVNTTGDVLKAAFQIIGIKPDSSVVSSVFLMSLPDGRTFTYGDCAVVPYPDQAQLASIAIDSADTHFRLTGEVPKVAMLSFSSKGSAIHPNVQLVISALELARKNQPNLLIDGELQFDAAFLSDIGQRKAPGSPVAGKANVYIFPNLDAGNIAYKITERLGNAVATGPIIQGLNRPMNDLSRGCSWEDIVNTAAVTCLQS